MNEPRISKGKLIGVVLSRYFLAITLMAVIFFTTAGTLAYPEAWIYLIGLSLLMGSVGTYLFIKDPALLERRMRMREREKTQKKVLGGGWIIFLLIYLLPGFDHRWDWSEVPVWLVILAGSLCLAGYFLVFLVFRENSYASRVVEVEEQQKVITGGLYHWVRHPMYMGSILLYCFSPLALGSYWATIPALLIIPILAIRAKNEEELLARELPGYREYMQHTRYRLLPGIW